MSTARSVTFASVAYEGVQRIRSDINISCTPTQPTTDEQNHFPPSNVNGIASPNEVMSFYSEIQTNDGVVNLFGKYSLHLTRHPTYRAYLSSYFCYALGDSIVQITNLWLLDELLDTAKVGVGESGDNEVLQVTLSTLTIARLLPVVVFAMVGGMMADRFDRRRLMIDIDLLSGLVILGILLLFRCHSLPFVYLVTVLPSVLKVTRYASSASILTDLLSTLDLDEREIIGGQAHDDIYQNEKQRQAPTRHLQTAVALMSCVRGVSIIIGNLLAGIVISVAGFEGCYVFYCASFFVSAFLISKGVGEIDYNKKLEHDNAAYMESNEKDAVCRERSSSCGDDMTNNDYNNVACSLLEYLAASGFGLLVLAKPSASLLWNSDIEDEAGARFPALVRTSAVIQNATTQNDAVRAACLALTTGLGFFFGPLLWNSFSFTDAHKPCTLQRACYIGLMLLNLGWLNIFFRDSFAEVLGGSFIRNMGSSAVGVFSSLILQILTDSRFLGRVLALEYMLTEIFRAVSYFLKINLVTFYDLSEHQLALIGAGIGLIVELFWGAYHLLSLGAARPRFNSGIKKE